MTNQESNGCRTILLRVHFAVRQKITPLKQLKLIVFFLYVLQEPKYFGAQKLALHLGNWKKVMKMHSKTISENR